MGLSADRRLRRGPDITAVVRQGRRVRAGGLVVHGLTRPGDTAAAGPRVAFIAPRTCGPAVDRNRTRRRVQESLRAMVAEGTLESDVDLVVRFLPEATGAGAVDLAGWFGSALRRLGATR